MTQITVTSHQYQFNKKNSNKKKSNTSLENTLSSSKTIKEISKYEVREIHTIRFLKMENQELTLTKEQLLTEILLVHNEIIQLNKNKNLINEGISGNQSLYGKVRARAMSIYFPTPFVLFKDEFLKSFSDGLVMKLGLSALFTMGLSIGGSSINELVNGFIIFLIIAILDAILGIIPGTVKGKRAQKDHTLQAKLWMFLTNLIGIGLAFSLHIFLSNLIKDPNFLQSIAVNCHYLVIAFVASIYFYRVIIYIATVNKARAPKFLSFFKKTG